MRWRSSGSRVVGPSPWPQRCGARDAGMVRNLVISTSTIGGIAAVSPRRQAADPCGYGSMDSPPSTVWVNGQQILHSRSMFVRHTVDITHAVRRENTLLIRCHALGPLIDALPARPRPRWKTALVQHQGLRWVRTSLLGRMRPWCPRVAAVGPWRPIAVESSPIEIRRAHIITSLDGCDGLARMRLDVRISPTGSRQPAIEGGILRVGGADARIESERIADDAFTLTSIVRLPDPRLWWPHTHGHPHTYDVQATLVGDVEETIDLGRVGFRTVSLDREQDTRGFGLVVNSVPVFCRGVCWTPIDLAGLSADPASYRTALEQLRDAGMNMVRVAGTTTYETETFYELCDQLGLMVWQDFMFANMDYPWQDRDFLESRPGRSCPGARDAPVAPVAHGRVRQQRSRSAGSDARSADHERLDGRRPPARRPRARGGAGCCLAADHAIGRHAPLPRRLRRQPLLRCGCVSPALRRRAAGAGTVRRRMPRIFERP